MGNLKDAPLIITLAMLLLIPLWPVVQTESSGPEVLGEAAPMISGVSNIEEPREGLQDRGRPIQSSRSNDEFVIILGDINGDTHLDQLESFRESIGLSTSVVSLADILASGTGADDQEKVKRYIYDAYTFNGARYVMLVGDANDQPGQDDTFPVRYVEATHDDPQSPYPRDLYFADLTDENGAFSDWDGDLDGRYGEFLQDGMDMIPEVAVGRVPASSAAEG